MLHPSTKKLIDRLNEMTLQRKIDWVQGETPETLAYDTEGYRVLLEGEPAALVLCDALGNELERASTDDLATTRHIDGGNYDTVIETMRADASRIALGTENAIASVLDGLNLDDAPESAASSDPIDIPGEEPVADAEEPPAFDAMEDSGDEIAISSAVDFDEELDAPETDIPQVAPPVEDVAIIADDTHEQFDAPPEGIDAHEAQSVEASQEISEGIISPEGTDIVSEPETGADDTPDIGKAVADLANQVNNAEESNPTSPPPARRPNPLLTQTAFNSIPSRASHGTLEEATYPTTAKDQDEPTGTPADEAALSFPVEEEIGPILSSDTHAPAVPLPIETEGEPPKIPGVGQVLSLSGLSPMPTEGKKLFEPETGASPIESAPSNSAESASLATPDNPAPQSPEPTSFPASSETSMEDLDIELEAAPEPPQKEAHDELTPPVAPDAPETDAPETDEPTKPVKTRFNPWI